jgi:hypothetical protein
MMEAVEAEGKEVAMPAKAVVEPETMESVEATESMESMETAKVTAAEVTAAEVTAAEVTAAKVTAAEACDGISGGRQAAEREHGGQCQCQAGF